MQQCRGFSADLPSIFDEEENTFVSSILADNSLDEVHLGEYYLSWIT